MGSTKIGVDGPGVLVPRAMLLVVILRAPNGIVGIGSEHGRGRLAVNAPAIATVPALG
jgi:hypothetical protein